MTVHYSQDFITDLDVIESAYRDVLFLTDSGAKIISEILDMCDSIGNYPLMGTDLTSKTGYENQYRFVVCRNYLLFYAIVDGEPLMSRAIDERMDYMRILFG